MAEFTNFATLSYRGGTLRSNTVTGEILETAVSGSYSAGDTLSYALGLVNSGTTDVTGLTLTDDLGAYELDGVTLYPLSYADGSARLFVNGVLQPAPAVTAGPPLTFSGIDIPAGGSAVVVYEAAVTEYAPVAAGSEITNTVTVSGSGVDLSASATVPVSAAAELTITKALSPAAVPANGELSYTFEISNIGSSEAGAADEVVVSDNFDPRLTNLTASFDGAKWARGVQYSYDEATGAFATLPGQITVPAASSTQNPDGTWSIQPGTATLTVTGIIKS